MAGEMDGDSGTAKNGNKFPRVCDGVGAGEQRRGSGFQNKQQGARAMLSTVAQRPKVIKAVSVKSEGNNAIYGFYEDDANYGDKLAVQRLQELVMKRLGGGRTTVSSGDDNGV